MPIGQIELITAIIDVLDRNDVETVNVRQLNAIARATAAILRELGIRHRPAEDAMGLVAWLNSDDTGLSSRAMARHLAPMAGFATRVPGEPRSWGEPAHPHPVDDADFGRCRGLLLAVPELRPYVPLMAVLSPEWATLATHWEELETLWDRKRERPMSRDLYHRMRELLAPHEKGGVPS